MYPYTYSLSPWLQSLLLHRTLPRSLSTHKSFFLRPAVESVTLAIHSLSTSVHARFVTSHSFDYPSRLPLLWSIKVYTQSQSSPIVPKAHWQFHLNITLRWHNRLFSVPLPSWLWPHLQSRLSGACRAKLLFSSRELIQLLIPGSPLPISTPLWGEMALASIWIMPRPKPRSVLLAQCRRISQTTGCPTSGIRLRTEASPVFRKLVASWFIICKVLVSHYLARLLTILQGNVQVTAKSSKLSRQGFAWLLATQ